jgi:hypothetical protein
MRMTSTSAKYLELCAKFPPEGDPGLRLAWDPEHAYFELYVVSGDAKVRKAPPFSTIETIGAAADDILQRVS